ncbi:MAG: hypothetical protein MMC23_000486 [Stictis urceolatum]|nr:hypothetical protein [Stictis urceolata]
MAQLGFGTRTQLLERPDRRYILKLLHIHAKKLGIYEGWPALNNIGLGGFVSRFMATMVPTVRRFNKWHHGFTASAVANSSNTPGGVFAPLIRGSGTPGKSNYFKRSHEQMVAEGSFVTLTGGDGYALTLSTLYFYLSHYPECQDRLAQELRAQFPEADVITSGPKLANCVYLRACIIEAMRMVPPASNVPWRECESGNSVLVGDSQIEKQRPGSESGVVQIPIGTDVGVSPYTIFRRKDIFREPARFWPERWLDPAQGGVIADDGERYRARQACKPFSIGPRNCSGQQVAMTMASVGVANILRDFEIRLADDKPDILKKVFEDGRPELDFELHFFTMWKEGPWVQFRSRGDSASAIGRS